MKLAIAASVLTAALGLMSVGQVQAADDEKCYGIAKAGENGCASPAGQAGGHSCAGHSTTDYSGADWKAVPAGTCMTMGGKMEMFEGMGHPS